MHCPKNPLQVLYQPLFFLLFEKKKEETFWIGQSHGDIGGFDSYMITIILDSFCILSFFIQNV